MNYIKFIAIWGTEKKNTQNVQQHNIALILCWASSHDVSWKTNVDKQQQQQKAHWVDFELWITLHENRLPRKHSFSSSPISVKFTWMLFSHFDSFKGTRKMMLYYIQSSQLQCGLITLKIREYKCLSNEERNKRKKKIIKN